MASELRVNTINSTAGFGTITVSETGQDLVGITTIENLTTENTLVGAAASFTGNVQVGGILTYEDVTNIDSVGLITARQGIEIGARPGVAASISVDGNMVVSGVSTFGGAGQFGGNVEISSGTLHVGDEIAHYGDTDTNIGFPAANTFTVDTAGSERLRVGSGGDVSVGGHATNYADSPLEVRGTNAGGDVAIRVTNNSTTAGTQAGLIFTTTTSDYTTAGIAYERGGSADALRFYVGQSAGAGGFDNATERLRIDSNGNMGLGVTPSANWVTSSDFRALQIGSGLVLYGRGSSDEDRGGLAVNAYHTGSAWKYLANGNASNVYLNDGNTDIQYASTNSGGADASLSWSTAFRSTSGGQVCMGNYHNSNTIGDYTPALQVGGTNANSACISINRWTNDAAGACLQLFKGRGTSGGAVDKGQDGDVVGSITWVQANNNNLNAGNTARIDCNIDAAPGGGDYPSRLTFWTCPDGSQTLAERMRITKDGNATFGKTTALGNGGTTGIEINGGSHYSMFVRQENVAVYMGRNTSTGTILSFLYNGTERGKVQTDGTIIAYQTSSDYRLKENAVAISDGITKLKQLKPYTFNFKETPSQTVQGFFAHEVETVVPGAVSGTKDAVAAEDDPQRGITKGDIEPQQMDYAKLTPLLTAALQEAIAKIEVLESEVAALKSS